MTKTYSYTVFIVLITLVLGLNIQPVLGLQEGLPEQMPEEYQDPNKVVSFDKGMSFSQAVSVLNQFSQKFEKRLVINRTDKEGSIGIDLPPMHWKEALNYIVRANNLQLVTAEDAYEIVRPKPTEQVKGEQPSQPSEQEKLNVGIGTREIRIEATFFEGNRRALKEVGVDWSTLTTGTPDDVSDIAGPTGAGALPGQFADSFVQVNARGAQSVSQSLFNSLINFGEVGAGVSVQALFSAFESDNIGQILAHPNIKVLEGEEGQIQVGQDFSIQQKTFSGNVTTTFHSVGTILTVTPYIVEQNDTSFIYLDIQAERSSAQTAGQAPVINKQTATTNIMLLDGEATAIAGLYRTEKATVRKGVPILKDLPPWVLGLRYLFGYNSTDQIVRELVIVIRASLEPSIPQRMAEKRKSTPDVLEKQREEYQKKTLPNDFNLDEDKPVVSTLFEDTKLQYYVIGGSYSDKDKAEQHQSRLIREGFDSQIVKQQKSDLFLVSYYQTRDSSKANTLLDEVKKDVNKQAWLYKNKKASGDTTDIDTK